MIGSRGKELTVVSFEAFFGGLFARPLFVAFCFLVLGCRMIRESIARGQPSRRGTFDVCGTGTFFRAVLRWYLSVLCVTAAVALSVSTFRPAFRDPCLEILEEADPPEENEPVFTVAWAFVLEIWLKSNRVSDEIFVFRRFLGFL